MTESIIPPIDDKIKVFEIELQDLLKKHNLQMLMKMNFPQYKILPIEVQLAIQVLLKEGVQYQIFYKEKEK